MMPLLVAPAANDLPEPKNVERARERTRERRLRGPNWSAPVREVKSACLKGNGSLPFALSEVEGPLASQARSAPSTSLGRNGYPF